MYIPDWQPNEQYDPGDSVVYHGRMYRTIQAHRSQHDWTPDATPSLWGAGQNAGGNPGYGGQPPAYPEPSRGMSGSGDVMHSGFVPMPDSAHEKSHRMPHYEPPAPEMPAFHGGPPAFPGVDRGVDRGQPQFPQHNQSPQSPVNPNRSTGGIYQSSSEWILDAMRRAEEFRISGPTAPTTWLIAERGEIPQYAIRAGDDHGEPLFIARNFHEGGLHIGWASLHKAAIGWGGAEIPLSTFEVLTGDANAVHWVPAASGGNARPVEGGYEGDGKPLWIGQAQFGGKIIPGKAAGWDSGVYVADGGAENAVMEYNVLVYR